MANSEVFVVLANLMSKEGVLNNESKNRVDELLKRIKNKKYQNIFFCGWAYRNDSNITIASAQKKYFESKEAKEHNIYLIEKSRDTVGDAVYSRKCIESNFNDIRVNVVTSDYHIDRSNKIFKFVFGKNYEINMISATTELTDQLQSEEKSLMDFRKTFKGVEEGDLEKIYLTMIRKHPFYNGEVY